MTDAPPQPPQAEGEPVASSDEPTVSLGVGVQRPPPHAIEIVGSEFRFLDPPETGAHAAVSVQLRNRSALPTGPLRITLSRRWLAAWRVFAADPPVLDDRVQGADRREFDFPGLDPDGDGTVELHLVATDDVVDPPEVRVALAEIGATGTAADDADEIGVARPETVAPHPRPGPARSVQISRLGLRAAVVPTVWEPPAFVVGQLRQSANLSEGNTVLIGHLNGLAGNVFANLAALQPGDEVIATSRGLEYRYVVSEVMELPGNDSFPTLPTDESRLTLMTCTGEWDPIGHDYSHRLWVVAEPAEAAAPVLAGEVPGPLTRQIGVAPAPAPEEPPLSAQVTGPSPKEAVAAAAAVDAEPVSEEPAVAIDRPLDGAAIPGRVTVQGRLLDAEGADRALWLLVRAEIDGSRWYPYPSPVTVRTDGSWQAEVEVGGTPGLRHTFVVAAVDPATDAQLRRHVAQRPGQPLSLLPDAFGGGARVTVTRR